jgi:hypothetical protein
MPLVASKMICACKRMAGTALSETALLLAWQADTSAAFKLSSQYVSVPNSLRVALECSALCYD